METPEGIREGSAVREAWASASSIKIGLPESTSKTHVRGEAVVVDLGERGVLFALIDRDSYREVSETFPSRRPRAFRIVSGISKTSNPV